MMKCDFCGTNMSLEDAACPFCGKLNTQAQQHIKDMERYKGAFESTQSDVYSVTKKYTGITVRAIVIAVLVVLFVVVTIFSDAGYSIKESFMRMDANRRVEEYSRILDTYMEEENYQTLLAFCDAHCIDYYDVKYECYAPVLHAGSYYAYLYEDIMSIATETDVEQKLAILEQSSYWFSLFYECFDMKRYEYYENADRQENIQTLQRMKENLELLLVTYIGLTEEEAAGVWELSSARRTVLMEEKLINEE